MTDLSCGQVAKLLGVNRSTVWRWADDYRPHPLRDICDIPGVYLTWGGHLRFSPEAVQWLRREHGRGEG
jgi:hypothetical protein